MVSRVDMRVEIGIGIGIGICSTKNMGTSASLRLPSCWTVQLTGIVELELLMQRSGGAAGIDGPAYPRSLSQTRPGGCGGSLPRFVDIE